MPSSDRPSRQGLGVGLGLRWSMLDEVLDASTHLPVDFFEVSPENYMRRGGYFPEALQEVAEHYKIRSHGLMMNLGGPEPLRAGYLQELKRFLDELGVDEHSDHLCWTGCEGQVLHDLLPLPSDHHSAQRVADKIRRAQDALGVPMAVENISYYAHLGPGQGLAEADFVAEVLEKADCRLLLDLNNVWVNARNHGFAPLDYLARLPLDRVAEIHVAGAERVATMQDLWIDTHGAAVQGEVVELMQWVLRRQGPIAVLYERDHNIPPLAELLDSVQGLREAYDEALRSSSPESSDSTTKPEALERGPTPDRRLQCMAHALLRPHDSAREAQIPMPVAGLQVYRQLVNNGLRGVCHRFLARCRSHRGRASFEGDLDRWLAGPGPRSSFLRDLPQEFFSFIRDSWKEDPQCPPYLEDLARHELIEFEVEAAPDTDPPIKERPLTLEDRLCFRSTATLLHYDHAVHLLSEDPAEQTPPPARASVLLAYRDADHDVRYLELSEMGSALVQRLLDGARLGEAVLAQARQDQAMRSDEQVQDNYLERVLGLLGELSERGALLGPRGDLAAHSDTALGA